MAAVSVVILKTEPNLRGYKLNPRQMKALPLIVAGKSGVDVAEAVGVSPVTVSHWLNHDQEFMRAMKAETEAGQEYARRILQAGAADAAKTLVVTATTGQNSANKTKAAQLVLERAGVIDDPLTVSGMDPQTAALVALIQQRRAEKQLDDAQQND